MRMNSCDVHPPRRGGGLLPAWHRANPRTEYAADKHQRSVHESRLTTAANRPFRYVGESVTGFDLYTIIMGTNEATAGISPPNGRAHANPVVIVTADATVAIPIAEPAVVYTFAACLRTATSFSASIWVSARSAGVRLSW
jgi:hypothetical protein